MITTVFRRPALQKMLLLCYTARMAAGYRWWRSR